VREYLDWFHRQAAALGHGYNGLMLIVEAFREEAGSTPDHEALMRVWREQVPEPVPSFDPPDPRLTGG
jgi:hypothetical protein